MPIVTIEGVVEEIIYSNYQNGYTVCVVDTAEEIVTATGYMPYLSEGENVKLFGRFVNHREYGRQFAAEYYEKTLPTTSAAILRYLASGIIKGVRLATAKKIVDKFGDDSLTILMTAPERLAEIKGISISKALDIGESYAQQQGVQSIVMFLQQYGIPPSTAFQVYRRYGSDALNYVKSNPYVLVGEFGRVSFKTADKLARALGIEKNSLIRIKAGIKYILQSNAMTNGHTYLPFDGLANTAAAMLDVEIAEAERAIRALAIEKQAHIQTVGGEDAAYLMPLYLAEAIVTKKLTELACERPLCSQKEADELIAAAERQMGLELADEQKQAVAAALRHAVMVLTGGPGTGKTTIVNAIISIMENKGLTVALAAPTGRAAKRAKELTGVDAKTIHRLLEFGYTEDESQQNFLRDDTNPLDEDVIIIDETSMVDISLAGALMRAVRADVRMIFVGDVDQLPPVGPGNLLADIIESGVVPTIRLTQIYRQAAESDIVQNAHRVILGEPPVWGSKDSDFFFLPRPSTDAAASTVAELCKMRLPGTYGYDPLRQIQVISAMKRGGAGVKKLNQILQAALNPPSPDKAQKAFGEKILREGDKVMQIKNNYDMKWESITGGDTGSGVFNGDIGFIEQIDPLNKQISVVLDDERRVIYSFDQVEELELAYAITVHKSQGSEFDAVVMPVYQAAPLLMRRKLFYTAITRAKKLVVLVGNEASIYTMVKNGGDCPRFTGLRWRLENAII